MIVSTLCWYRCDELLSVHVCHEPLSVLGDRIVSTFCVSSAVCSQDRHVIVSTFCWHRCGELLSAVQSLATHENSLRIQAMQAHK